MQNNQNQGVSKCEAHSFSLRALYKERRPNLSASLSMCRYKPHKGRKNAGKSHRSQAPLFNHDRSFATPAFILSSQKADYAANAAEFLLDHEKKVREHEQSASQMLVPKPRSKNMYCNVCREGYEEYLEHIRSPAHRSSIRNCPFNAHILELQRAFNPVDQRDLSQPISETVTVTGAEEEGQALGARGRKRVKTAGFEGNNAVGSPPADTNQNYTLTGSTQNLFYSQPTLPYPLAMMGRVSDCRGFYGQCGPMGFNSFYSLMPQGMGYPMYCLPYQPMLPMEFFQQQ